MSDGRPFHQIATDGGYLAAPVRVDKLLLGVAERAEVIVDFTGLAPGTTLELRNDAPTPFPDGDAPNEHTGVVMQFRVVPLAAPDDSQLPTALRPIPQLGGAEITRTLTLYEALDANQNSLGVFLDGKRWGHDSSDVTELPRAYSTEIWEIVNTTDDAHPIHIHLIDFLILNRQNFDADGYRAAYEAMNPGLPRQDAQPLPVTTYLRDQPMPPAANEAGLKDTLVVPPNQVSRILVRFAPETGDPFPFDPTLEPGYVWHCHILEHEDNEMMRRLKLTPAAP
jgi:FtsP/CotA-like multicopper oxidase with cupredoxin domain